MVGKLQEFMIKTLKTSACLSISINQVKGLCCVPAFKDKMSMSFRTECTCFCYVEEGKHWVLKKN